MNYSTSDLFNFHNNSCSPFTKLILFCIIVICLLLELLFANEID